MKAPLSIVVDDTFTYTTSNPLSQCSFDLIHWNRDFERFKCDYLSRRRGNAVLVIGGYNHHAQ
jgi:hypothetical protein